MDEPQLPELRASDADRERSVDRLRSAAGDGQLTMEELDERLNAAYAARTQGELEQLTADLQVPAHAQPAKAGTFSVRPGEGGARWLVAIMGGCDRKGRWRLSPRATSLNIMGGADLDLNEVELAAERVTLTVVSIMGGADIHVPEGLDVEVSEFAFMGGNDIEIGERAAPGTGPVLHLRVYSLMGGTSVKRGPKLTRAERRALKQERRKHLGH